MRGGAAPSRVATWEQNNGLSGAGARMRRSCTASWRHRPHVTVARLVARTVRGLEQVVADEVRGLGFVERIGYREVWFRCAEPDPAVLALRCADDVLLHAVAVRGIGSARADLRLLTEAASALPVRELLAARRRFGGPDSLAGVEVSASFVGRRNFNRYDLEDAVGRPVAAALGVPYWSRRGGVAPPEGGLAWRVLLEGDRALVGLRVGARPLHRREYRVVTRAGSVHPPVAAAMARLGGSGGLVLDPCCGAGTLAVEAALAGAGRVLGLDRDPAAVAAGRANWAAAIGAGAAVREHRAALGSGAAARERVAATVAEATARQDRPAISVAATREGPAAGGPGRVHWGVADAGRLPVPDGAVDLVLCNPPWDRQVAAAGVLARRPGRFWRELRRVLRPGGRAVLLVPEADQRLVRATGFRVLERREISLAGRRPEIVVLAAVTGGGLR